MSQPIILSWCPSDGSGVPDPNDPCYPCKPKPKPISNLPVTPNACGSYGEVTQYVRAYDGSNTVISNVYVGADGGTSGSYAAVDALGPPAQTTVLVCCPIQDIIVTYNPGVYYSAIVWYEVLSVGASLTHPATYTYEPDALGTFLTAGFAEEAIASTLANSVC